MTGQPPFHVYAYLDADGVYLYIGQTSNLTVRNHKHRHQSPWFEQATTRAILSSHPLRVEAQRAEAAAIRERRPLHNIRHNGPDLGGQALRILRKEHGLTLRELAPLAGISASQLCRVESGKQGSPAVVDRIFAALVSLSGKAAT